MSGVYVFDYKRYQYALYALPAKKALAERRQAPAFDAPVTAAL